MLLKPRVETWQMSHEKNLSHLMNWLVSQYTRNIFEYLFHKYILIELR